MVEELLERSLQVVICDPLDVWYGLRSSWDGKKDGFKILVIGGEHGDIPLTAKSGVLIADFLVENAVSAVLCTRHFSKTEQRNFYADFLERLYHRKGEVQYRTPLHLVVDEADELAPQRLFPGTERVFGALDTIVRRGRSSGIGVTMISQRSAALNKDCLTQIEVLVALRTISPQDRKAIEAWIDAHHDDDDRQKKFMDSLSSLPIGTAWFWSPGWLDCFSRVSVRKRKTFDSSSTPKVGDKVVAPKKIAAVDLEKLKAKMAETIERVKADDPAVLKQRIRELEGQLKAQPVKTDPDEIKKAEFRGEMRILKKLTDVGDPLNRLESAVKKISDVFEAIMTPEKPKESGNKFEWPKITGPVKVSEVKVLRDPAAPKQRTSEHASDESLGRCERSILIALAQSGACTKSKAALISGYSVNSGGFNNSLSKLRQSAYINGTVGGLIEITDLGRTALGDYQELPTGVDLQNYWINKLPRCEREILRFLIGQMGGACSKQEIGTATQYSENSGGFNNALSKLRTLELIEGSGSNIRAVVALVE
jgi:hypothetical protein